jgi:hypothetical protein
MSIKIQGDVVIYDDKVFKVGSGNIAARPGTPALGMIWYNTELSRFEGYDGTSWAALALGTSDQLALTLATLALA